MNIAALLRTPRTIPRMLVAAVLAAPLTAAPAFAQVSVDLEPGLDATLYSENTSAANGSGSFLFTGFTNNGDERRAVLSFDIAGAVPAGATITQASLQLTMSRTRGGTQTVQLRRITESWTEGPADADGNEGQGATAAAGDVTWMHRTFPGTPWATQGASFSASASASQQIGGNGAYSWASTPQLVADVQDWLDDPSSNHGWLLLQTGGGTQNAKRYNSKENATASSRPRLTITYQAAVAAPAAAFTFAPPTPTVGEPVSFTDQSTGSPNTWEWDFDDGGSSTLQNPMHAFTAAGTYTVSLTVTNGVGSDSTTMEVTVTDTEPELTELVLVPGVAFAGGAGTSFFVTTLDVHNAGAATASFRLLWLPRDADNSNPLQSALFTLGPGQVRRFQNLLADAFNLTDALGAVAVLSDSAELEVMGRTYNDAEDGTFGQSSPGVPEDELIVAGERALLLFMTQNSDFRSNLGIASAVEMPITVNWELFGPDGQSLGTGSDGLAPFENIQINRVFRNFSPIEGAYLHVWTDTTGGAFTCFGSVLDNATSDPTTVLPR